MGHALIVLLGVGGTPSGEKGFVYLHPHTVGVDKGSVQIKISIAVWSPVKNQYSSQKRQGKSTASWA